MSKLNSFLKTALLALTICFCFTPQRVFALAESDDLDLDGASVTALAQGGGFVFATAEGPKGIFISSNFGESWSFAAGGEYSFGFGKSVVTTADRVFAVLDAKLFVSTLSATPSWSEVDLGLAEDTDSIIEPAEFIDQEEANALATDGVYLFITSNHAKVRVVRISSLNVVDTISLPGITEPISMPRIAVDPSTDSVFFQQGEVGDADAIIYRAPYNFGSGHLGSLEDKTPAQIIAQNTRRLGGVYSNGAGIIYVTTFGEGDSSAGIYRSTDNGDSYTRVVSSSANAGLNFAAAAFNGNTHLVGRFVSTNGGGAFTETSFPNTEEGVTLDSAALLIDSADADLAMGSTALGPIITENLSAADNSVWELKLSGLRGVLVNDMAQNSSNEDVVILALDGGLARTTNFTASESNQPIFYDHPLIPEIGGDKITDDFNAALLDPSANNIVYAGGSSLYKVEFADNGDPTWSVIVENLSPGENVSDLANAGDNLVVSYANTGFELDGQVLVLNRSNLEEQSVALEGLPVSALAAISESIIYAGVGGVPSLVEDAKLAENRGLYRSTDGGATFEKVGKGDLLEAGITSLSYDPDADIIYAAAILPVPDDGDDSDDDDGDDEPIEGRTDEEAMVFTLRNASGSKLKISQSNLGFSDNESVGAVVAAVKEGQRRVFVASDSNIYVSNSFGETWALFYEGLNGESTKTLFFDGLVKGSNAGFDGLSGEPNLIVSKVPNQIKGGSRAKIGVKFSKDFLNSAGNRRQIKVKVGADNVLARITKRNSLTVGISPIGTWPVNGKVRIVIPPRFKADDGEQIDSDYDGALGGSTYRETIRIR